MVHLRGGVKGILARNATEGSVGRWRGSDSALPLLRGHCKTKQDGVRETAHPSAAQAGAMRANGRLTNEARGLFLDLANSQHAMPFKDRENFDNVLPHAIDDSMLLEYQLANVWVGNLGERAGRRHRA